MISYVFSTTYVLTRLSLLRDMSFQNVSDLDFDLSRPLRLKTDAATELPIHGFILVYGLTRMLYVIQAFKI